jgi:uncharacterized protein (DUF779 family)
MMNMDNAGLISVEVTEEAVQYIRDKGAKEVTVMLAKSGGC